MPPATIRPVFFDPDGRRAKIVNVVLKLLASAATVVVSINVVGLIIAPTLPSLPVDSEIFAAIHNNQLSAIDSPEIVTSAQSGPPVSQPSYTQKYRAMHSSAMATKRFAFHSFESPGSTSALLEQVQNIDALISDVLDLAEADGRILGT